MTHTGEINGFPFSYMRKHVEHNIRLSVNDTSSRYGNAIDQFYPGGPDITVDVLADTQTELDDLLTALMQRGEGEFMPGNPHTGWHFTGVVGDISSDLRLSNYVPERKYPVSFLFRATLPFLISDVQYSRGRYIPTAGYEFSTDDCYPSNLIENGDFENWTNGTTNTPPDKWSFNDPDGPCVSITRSATHKNGSYSCALAFDGTAGATNYIRQYIACKEYTEYTAGIWLKVTGLTQGQAQFRLRSGTAVFDEIIVTSNCDWTFYTFDYTFSVLDPDVYVDVYGYHASGVNNGAVFYIDSVVLTEKINYEKNTFGNQITTSGKVAVTPDIEVAAAYLGASGPAPGGSFTVNDNGSTWSTNQNSYQLNYTITVPAVSGVSHRLDVARCKQWSSSTSYTQWVKITATGAGYNGGVETTIMEYSTTVLQANMVSRNSVTYGTPAITFTANSPFSVKIYVKTGGSGTSYAKYLSVDYTEMGTASLPSALSLYNTADTLTKFNIDSLVPGSAIRVNPTEGTGEYRYSDDYATNQYSFIATISGAVTWSSTNKNISIPNTAYLIYPFAVKLPVQGIPYLVLYVNSGYPQVYIAADNAGTPGTFYAVDNNPTVGITNDVYIYSLNNAANLQLASSNKFYVKIIPASGQAVTISAIHMYATLQAIYVEMPQIFLGAANTFKVDMAANTPCYVSLFWHDWKWGI